jgi:hypothetical protein
MAPYRVRVALLLAILVAETGLDLLPPPITEHIIDDVLIPAANLNLLLWFVGVLLWDALPLPSTIDVALGGSPGRARRGANRRGGHARRTDGTTGIFLQACTDAAAVLGADDNEEWSGEVTDEQAKASSNGDVKKHTPTPITVTHPENVDISKVRLYREPEWKLRLTIEGDRSYIHVKVVRAAPLSHPSRYICLLDAKDEEVCMIPDMKQMDDEMRGIVQQELDRRYLTSTIESVLSIRNEFGTSYWDVESNRGRREFVVQNVAENAQWLGDHRLLLVDVDGNRFEIPDLGILDKKSLGLVEMVL